MSGSSDGSVKVWEVATKQCLHTFTDHSDQVKDFPSGCLPVQPSFLSCTVFLLLLMNHFTQVWSVKYNKEGNQVSSVSDDKTINIYSIPV